MINLNGGRSKATKSSSSASDTDAPSPQRLFVFGFGSGYTYQQAVVMATSSEEATQRLIAAISESCKYTHSLATIVRHSTDPNSTDCDPHESGPIAVIEVNGPVAFTYGVDG